MLNSSQRHDKATEICPAFPTHIWLFSVMIMTRDCKSIVYEFKYSPRIIFVFESQISSQIILILNTK